MSEYQIRPGLQKGRRVWDIVFFREADGHEDWVAQIVDPDKAEQMCHLLNDAYWKGQLHQLRAFKHRMHMENQRLYERIQELDKERTEDKGRIIRRTIESNEDNSTA